MSRFRRPRRLLSEIPAGDAGVPWQWRGRFIVLYGANRITLSATTNLNFMEDVGAPFAAYGWHVQPATSIVAIWTARVNGE